jgi:glycosyltransferase involved in cell wall biosynthesis
MADIGVTPSLFEPFGYVAVEMMMHGLPIVTTATSGLNEIVDDSCGLKVPIMKHPDKVEIDTDLLAEKIVYLLQHPVEAKRMGRNGRKRYLEKYDSSVFKQNMTAFYRSLCERTNA